MHTLFFEMKNNNIYNQSKPKKIEQNEKEKINDCLICVFNMYDGVSIEVNTIEINKIHIWDNNKNATHDFIHHCPFYWNKSKPKTDKQKTMRVRENCYAVVWCVLKDWTEWMICSRIIRKVMYISIGVKFIHRKFIDVENHKIRNQVRKK